MNPQDHAYALPAGYMLEEYRIERMLGSGGFGITYLAHDTHLNKRVAVKEYLPNDFAVRYAERMVGPKSSAEAGNYQWGLERFLAEAQVLAGFDHAHINRVHRRFQAHGTAYLVLEYVSGETLSERLRRTKVLSPEEALRLFREMLSGLEVVHRQGYVHRDIKPGNILFREDDSAVLLDFGAARQLVGQRTQSVTSLLTPGYAPIEQYDNKSSDVGPWSDFYALGVTAYCCVTGVSEGALLDATVRSRLESRGEVEQDMRPAEEAARGGYDRRLLRAIDGCMKVDERERPRDVAALRTMLEGAAPGPVPPNPPPGPDGDKDKPSPSDVWTGSVLLLLVGLGVWQCWQWLSPLLFEDWRDDSGKAPAPAVFRDALKSGGEGPQMVVLPTGSFRMGSPSGETGRESDDGPVRTVTIGKHIAMGRYEVTVGEFRRFVTASGYRTEAERNVGGSQGCRTLENTTRNTWDWTPGRFWLNLEYTVEEDQPVVCVSWHDARRYIKWLNEETGGGYRLPSESEWEYAVRAGSVSRYHFGDDESELCRYGNVADTTRLPNGNVWTNKANCSDGAVYPTAVGSYRPNPFGLYDLHGNVREWVADCYVDSYAGAPIDGSARRSGCGSDVRAVVRGGSWSNSPRGLRSAYRGWSSPSYRDNILGFRLVQDLNP